MNGQFDKTIRKVEWKVYVLVLHVCIRFHELEQSTKVAQLQNI